MNINLKFNYKEILPFVLKRFSLVLWVFLILVILSEGLVIKSSFNKIQKANEQVELNSASLVRVNFSIYDQIEKRLNDNISFAPAEPTTTDPFGIATKK